jgi:hypothetical protein
LQYKIISVFETELYRIIHLSESSTASCSTYLNIVNDVFNCAAGDRDCLPSWIAKSQNYIIADLSLKDTLLYIKANEHILKLPSNHWPSF